MIQPFKRRLLFSLPRMPTMLCVRAAASAVAGGTRSIALGARHSLTLHAADGAAPRHVVGPALSFSFSVLQGDKPARCYSVSSFVRGGAASVGDNGKSSVHSAAAPAGRSPKEWVLGVQRKGDKDSAVIAAAGEMIVGLLKKEIKRKLELTASLDTITLQLASEDGTLLTAKDAAGKELPVTLNSMDTVDEALKKAAKQAGREINIKDKLRIIVDVAAVTPNSGVEGECCVAVESLSECAIATGSSLPLLLISPAGPWFPDRTDNVDVRKPARRLCAGKSSTALLNDIFARYRSGGHTADARAAPSKASADLSSAVVPLACDEIGSMFPFVNRQTSCAQLFDIVKKQDFLRSSSGKRKHSSRDVSLAVCTGLSGLGKTRFALDGLVRGAQQEEAAFGATGLTAAVLQAAAQGRNIAVNAKELLGSNCSLGGAVAYEWMLPRCVPASRAALESAIAAAQPAVSLTDALDFIYQHTTTTADNDDDAAAPAVLLNIDEAHFMSVEALVEITQSVCRQLVREQRRVFVVFTGLSPTRITTAVRSSYAAATEVHLPLLEHEHMLEILRAVAPAAFRDDGGISPSLSHVLWWLGGCPRNLARLIMVVRDSIQAEFNKPNNTVTWGDVGKRLAELDLSQVDAILRLTEKRIIETTDASTTPLVAAFSFALTAMPICGDQLLPTAEGGFATVMELRSTGAFHFSPRDDWRSEFGDITVPPLSLYTARMLSSDVRNYGSSATPQFPLPALDGCAPVLSWQENETMTASVLLHKLYALGLRQRGVPASVYSTTASGTPSSLSSSAKKARLSELGIKTGGGINGLIDVDFTCPRQLHYTRLSSRVTAAKFPEFVAATRTEGLFGAYINADGASFADAFIILPDLVILLQDKQKIEARRDRFEGKQPSRFTLTKVESEFRKITKNGGLEGIGNYVFLLVTDEDGPSVDSAPPGKNVQLVPYADHQQLLGKFCAKLRATAILASRSEVTDLRVQKLTGKLDQELCPP